VKNILAVLVVVAGSLCGPAVFAFTAQEPRAAAPDTTIAARVNGDAITWGEVKRLIASPAERQLLLKEAGRDEADDAQLQQVAMRMLIRRRLILQEARRREFTVEETAVDQAVTALRRRFSDLKALGMWMREQGIDERSLFDTIRTEMLASRVRAALLESVRVTDEETERYYDAHKADLTVEQVRLQIIVAKDEAAAQEILTALKQGENFGALAAARSAGARASRGGDTGWVNAETLWAPLRAAVARMAPRQAHGPLKRDSEYLVVRLDDRRTTHTTTLSDAVPQIERRLLPEKQRAAMEAWLADQESRSSIERFPPAH
jgi:parvulin-like peptidyl-prolyl isomerase